MIILTQDMELVNVGQMIQTDSVRARDDKIYIYSVNQIGNTLLGMYTTRERAQKVVKEIARSCERNERRFIMPECK